MCRFITDANFPCVSPSLIHKVGPATQASGFTCITVVLSLSNRSLSLSFSLGVSVSLLCRERCQSPREEAGVLEEGRSLPVLPRFGFPPSNLAFLVASGHYY